MSPGIHEVSGSRPPAHGRQAGGRANFASAGEPQDSSADSVYIVAFSGGADSVLAANAAAATGKAMTIFYLHHYAAPVEPERLNVFAETRKRYPSATWISQQADISRIAKRMGYSWEHTASLMRRKRLLCLRAATVNAEVMTGHNYSDYLETIALRRARKIPEALVPPLSGRCEATGFLRPLFRMTRGEVRERVAGLGLSWFDDPSNTDTKFARNRLRSAAAPLSAAGPGEEQPQNHLPSPEEEPGMGRCRELRLPYSVWQSLAPTDKARLLFNAFRRLAIVRKFTPNHFARARKLPFALPPFFAHEENDAVIFRRGLGRSPALAVPDSASYIRGDAVKRSLVIPQPYGKKSVAKIFSEKKLSPRQRRQTLVYLNPDLPNVAIRIVFPDRGQTEAAPL